MTTTPAARIPLTGVVTTVAGLAAVGAVYVRALAFTPVERFQGPAQKIVYLHASAAIIALFAFSVCGILSLVYLGIKDLRLDRAAASSAEVGVVLSVVLLTTGPLYGKPVWGTWWEWEARLASTLFIFLLFVGYLILRAAVEDPEQRAKFSAVIGILGLALVPFVHLTVYLFRTQHPQPVLLRPSRPDMPAEMFWTFIMAIGAFLVLYVGLVNARYVLATVEERRRAELLEDIDAGRPTGASRGPMPPIGDPSEQQP